MAKQTPFRRRTMGGFQRAEDKLISSLDFGRLKGKDKTGTSYRRNDEVSNEGGIRTWRRGEGVSRNGTSRAMKVVGGKMELTGKSLPPREEEVNERKPSISQKETFQSAKIDKHRGERGDGHVGAGHFDVEALSTLPKHEPMGRQQGHGKDYDDGSRSEARYYKTRRRQLGRGNMHQEALSRKNKEQGREQKGNQAEDWDKVFEREPDLEPPAEFGGRRL